MIDLTIFEAWNDFFSGCENVGSISESDQLHTYPSPDPTLTLTCYFLIVVELGGRGGRFRISQILTLTLNVLLPYGADDFLVVNVRVPP